MKKISGTTFFAKKVGPTIWLVGVLAVLLLGLWPGVEIEFPIAFFLFALGLLAAGILVFRKYAWALSDEVYDLGNALLFRKGRKEQTVKFKDVLNVNFAGSPGMVDIQARNEGEIGKVLSFSLPFRINFLSKDPFIEDLINRIDDARNA